MRNPAKAIIVRLSRTLANCDTEELTFSSGLNLIVGPPNAGKSTWLTMLDFALGKDSQPQAALGAEIAAKYTSIEVEMALGDQELTMMRAWTGVSPRTKTTLNGQQLTSAEFSDAMLAALHLPILRFPQGNPYSDRTWPSLSFRAVLRHLYRAETAWSDLAPQQPDSEQHAVIALLTGVAEVLFPPEYGNLVQAQKEMRSLEAEKSAYERVASEIAVKVLDVPGLRTSITPASVTASREALLQELAELRRQRDQRPDIEEQSQDESLNQIASRHANAVSSVERLATEGAAAQQRLAELRTYAQRAQAEKSRLRRAQIAGLTLGQFPVVVCPMCESALPKRVEHECPLCGSVHPRPITALSADERIQFELDQLDEELRELGGLEGKLTASITDNANRLALMRKRATEAADQLSVFREAVRDPQAAVRRSQFDVAIGRVEQKLDQIERVESLLAARASYGERIVALSGRVEQLRHGIDGRMGSLSLSARSEELSDGMNTYLNKINAERRGSWPEPPASFALREKDFSLLVGNQNWRAVLGGTLRLYLLFAYHYGLMSLDDARGSAYPGFCIMDLPPSLAEGPEITEYGDYAIRPFLELLGRTGQQLIVSGREFPTIANANRIELQDQWRV